MKIREMYVPARMRGQRKLSQVLGAFALLVFTVTGRFRLARFLKLMNRLFVELFQLCFSGRGKPWITETADKGNRGS
jgi:tellurite resistance protein TehA-like permease